MMVGVSNLPWPSQCLVSAQSGHSLKCYLVVLGLGESRDICCDLAKMIIVELTVELKFTDASKNSNCQILFPFIS